MPDFEQRTHIKRILYLHGYAPHDGETGVYVYDDVDDVYILITTAQEAFNWLLY
jgi:hypothetical protein